MTNVRRARCGAPRNCARGVRIGSSRRERVFADGSTESVTPDDAIARLLADLSPHPLHRAAGGR
jgi:hypothetical protein